jgi:hypothetical protein
MCNYLTSWNVRSGIGFFWNCPRLNLMQAAFGGWFWHETVRMTCSQTWTGLYDVDLAIDRRLVSDGRYDSTLEVDWLNIWPGTITTKWNNGDGCFDCLSSGILEEEDMDTSIIYHGVRSVWFINMIILGWYSNSITDFWTNAVLSGQRMGLTGEDCGPLEPWAWTRVAWDLSWQEQANVFSAGWLLDWLIVGWVTLKWYADGATVTHSSAGLSWSPP